MPSRPMRPTSTLVCFGLTATTDANPASGKYTSSMRLFGLSSTFLRFRLTASRSGSNNPKSAFERDESNRLPDWYEISCHRFDHYKTERLRPVDGKQQRKRFAE